MAQPHVLALMALGAAFAGSCALALVVAQALSSRLRARQVQSQAGLGNVFVQLMRNGIPVLNPLADAVLGIRYVQEPCSLMAQLMRERVAGVSPRSVCTLCLATCVLIVAAGTLAGSFVAGVLCAGAGMAFASARVTALSNKRVERMTEELPNALNSMGACFHAGFTLLQTFEQLASEVDGPLAGCFARARDALRTGATTQQALAELQGDAAPRELAFVSVALRVQHASGGSMQHVLAAAADALSDELELKRSIRVQTAQARLSSKVVVGVTLGLVAVLSLATKGFLDPFFQSPLGLALLACAVCMQVGGIVMVRRLLRVGGE